jgi:D-alanine-D-alanine ligase
MKKNIAIIMGGYSSEAHISLQSGAVVYENLSTVLYNPYRVHIMEDDWTVLDKKGNKYPINKHNFSAVINGHELHFDCVFNAIHGHPGENGIFVAYLELLKIPHTSAPSYQMGLTFNKRDCLSVVKEYDIKTADSCYINKGDTIDVDQIIAKVGLPCFVKPNSAGSSFGISKVIEKSEIVPAIEKAHSEDNQVLIESFLNGTEVTIGVLNYKGAIRVLPMTEIVTHNEFFDYKAKYLGESEEITPARISEKVHRKLEKIAKKIYTVLNMSGITRSEFIVVNEEPYFLEMNTVPGLTNASLIPQQAAMAGISLEDLFQNAIELAQKT